jgi:hypothetical protein
MNILTKQIKTWKVFRKNKENDMVKSTWIQANSGYSGKTSLEGDLGGVTWMTWKKSTLSVEKSK